MPYLKDGNVIGFCDPKEKAGLVISIGERSQVLDKTLGAKAEYPPWLPMSVINEAVDYDQSVCSMVCKGFNDFWNSTEIKVRDKEHSFAVDVFVFQLSIVVQISPCLQ